jgi:outer membrane receptor protein involved in Fe transport
VKLGLRCSAALALVMALAPAAALAQTSGGTSTTSSDSTSAPVSTADQTQVGELTVVGSHIRRDNFSSPSPVDVITHDEVTIAGFGSTDDVLLSNSVTTGTAEINSAFGNFVVNGGGGVNTLGLRGLDPSRTLILLNGRRVTPSGSRGAVGAADINVLPDAIIDHIEILKDGASSIYGSDAIAGVVNIITKSNITGVTLEGYYSAGSGFHGDEGRASVVAGIVKDDWQLSGSLEVDNKNDLTLGERDWTRCNTSYTFNADGSSADFIDPKTGQPKCYPIDGTGDNGVTVDTLGTPATHGPPGTGPAVGAVGDPVLATYNRWRPNAAIMSGLIGYEGVSGGSVDVRDTFDPRMLNQSILSPDTDYHLFAQGSYDIHALGNAQVYFEVLASQRDSTQVGFRQLTVDYPILNACTPGVSSSNPLLPIGIGCLGTFLPAGGSLITSGKATSVRAFIGDGDLGASQREDYWKATAGIRGDLPFGWQYDAYVAYADSDSRYGQQTYLTNQLSQTLDVVAAPAGTDPSLVVNGVTCRVNITSPGSNCVPAPVLTPSVIAGNLPAAWHNYFTKDVFGDTKYSEATVSIDANGNLFKLPYGEVKGAFGIEYRGDSLNDTPPIDSQDGNLYNLTSAAITRGTDSVVEGYGEIEIPILKDLPFAHELTANISGRVTDYHSYGMGETYKVTGLWAPTDWLSFRVTDGTSFRAPALFEQFLGATSGFLSNQTDPCNNYGTGNPTTNLYKNCDAELHNPTFTDNQSVAVLTAGGASLGLKAETSDNLTAGVVIEPHLGDAWGHLSIAVDYFSITVNDGVDRVGAQNLLNFCYNSAGFRAAGSYCSFIDPRAAGTNALTVHDSYTNIATNIVNGFDYDVRYTRDFGEWKATINGQVTQYLSQANKVLPTDPLQELNGTVETPAYTGELEGILAIHKLKIRYNLNWVSVTNSYNLIFGPGANLANTGFQFATPNYFTHDISVQYADKGWEVTGGVHNLGDKKPPSISYGFYDRVGDAPLYSGYDFIGRTFFLDLTKKF